MIVRGMQTLSLDVTFWMSRGELERNLPRRACETERESSTCVSQADSRRALASSASLYGARDRNLMPFPADASISARRGRFLEAGVADATGREVGGRERGVRRAQGQ